MQLLIGGEEMARGRIIANQISISEQVNDMSLKAAFLFTWMIPHLDDFGCLSGQPRKVKALVVPLKSEITAEDIPALLMEMKAASLITLYQVNGEIYLKFNNFDKHQTGLHKRTSSKFPSPEAGEDYSFSGKFREIPGNSGLREEKRREENRRDYLEYPEGYSLSGKPDVLPLVDQKMIKNQEWKSQAIEVLQFLNERCGRNYGAVESNLNFIIGRLKEGATVAECRQIIAKKRREWLGDEKMFTYLRPATLFNKTKFWTYHGELGSLTADEVLANNKPALEMEND